MGDGDPALAAVTDRVALVTGGNRGIGLGIALDLVTAGHQVAITCRGDAPTAVTDAGIMPVACDITDRDQVDNAFDQIEQALGPVEIVVSNAGITRDGLVLKMADDDFTAVLDANLTGGFRVARRAVKSMMRGRWGRIVFISSIVGTGGQAGQANYAASKAGLVGLSRSLAKEFASRNITVNVVAPGPIATDMIDALPEDRQAAITAAVPLGRIGDVDDVAAAVRFLTSDSAGYITGVVLPVDGGMAMGA